MEEGDCAAILENAWRRMVEGVGSKVGEGSWRLVGRLEEQKNLYWRQSAKVH